MPKGKRVAVMGAGVAGLTVAHELAERGFEVVVFENRTEPGGKSRSMPVDDSGKNGRPPLPAEHGFRFFPGFYRHVPDTMQRIPYRGGTVADNLVPASRITIARRGGGEIVFPAHLPISPQDVGLALGALRQTGIQVPPQEVAYFLGRLTALLRSCQERRYREFEEQSWWEFSGAAQRSRSYQRFLADGLTRTLVAARATEMSARTGGFTLLQLLSDMARVGKQVDRVLNGPTSDVWITPWARYLSLLGVEFHYDSRVVEIVYEEGRISRIMVRTPATSKLGTQPEPVVADYYVAAVPVEIMVEVLKDNEALLAAEPRLAGLANLVTCWMNGVMFYLRTDVPLERGHTIYIDSQWALTSISQQQFWPDVDLSRLGDGRVRGILSVDVSDWNSPGINGKTAMQCRLSEFVQEVWCQLKEHLNDDRLPDLVDDNVLSAWVDTAVEWPNPPETKTNAEQLLINTPGSWKWRPDAVTSVPNLFLAADYVRTYTDLATMEGANEAARRAVNGILDAYGHPGRCDVWKLREPAVLAPVRAADRLWLELEPHVPV